MTNSSSSTLHIGDTNDSKVVNDHPGNQQQYNGKGRTGLPVPGTFIINKSGEIVAAFAEHDYMQRMEPAMILDTLKSLP